jgi:iron(III) transport system substrate-binding protein
MRCNMFAIMPLLLAVCLMLLAGAQEKGWEKEWNDAVSGAKREGKVVVLGPSDPGVRRELPARFTARFGIPVEYIGGFGGEVAARLRTERQAQVYTMDVFLTGIGTAATILYPEKMLDPIASVLILPEVLNLSRWKKGKLWFVDPEERYILRLFNTVTELFFVNTQYVKLEEFPSIRDLLNPKWKGKICLLDPTGTGPGPGVAARLYLQLGEEFVKKLYIDQKPAITRDTRQLTDWLARGTHPIALSTSVEVRQLEEEGFSIKTIYRLPDFVPGSVSSAQGLVALLNKAPHPNAARVFVNWIASKEGLEIYARPQLNATTRNDIDESFVRPDEIPRPGVNYFDNSGWEFSTTEKEKVRLRMKELLKR